MPYVCREQRLRVLRAHVGAGQIENEFGFLGPNERYLRHLLATARASLGADALIYTTDPPPNLGKGTLPGADVYSCAPHSLPYCFLPSSLFAGVF